MKRRLCEYLACPECSGVILDLHVLKDEGGEIVDGLLTCATCARVFPVIAGVPRLLPDALVGALGHYHPRFFEHYGVTPPGDITPGPVARTLDFFTMQRPELFSQTLGAPLRAYLEKSLAVRLPWTRDLGGQFGLDAGCGEGRYLYLMTETGAEVVGMDLGNSVDFAYGRNRDNARSHVVQASIFQPPFREGVFDFFFSIGVLHHLPDPEAGFAALVPLLKEGGSAMIWVYGLTDMNQIYQLSHLTAVRPLTSRLSPRATYAAAVPIATALELFAFAPVRLLSHLAAVSERIPPQLQEVSELPFTTKIAEVHDRIGAPVTFFPTYEDLDGWFSRAHLEGVEILKTSGSRGWSARGFRSARSAEPVLPQAPASNGT